MSKPTSTYPRAIHVFRAAAVALGGLLMATLLLPFGCSPSGQGCGPAPGPPKGDSRTTVEHDIAPWDGPAFSLWIPAETFGGKPDSWIYLRIWNAPEKSQKKFVFPDETMKLGAVKYFLDLKSPRAVDWKSQPREELKGWVQFIKANRRQPVVGEFDFLSEEATLLNGRFEAQWINKGWLEKAEQSDAADSR
jgi:hypothetical protein